jgi:zinc transporter ZupT
MQFDTPLLTVFLAAMLTAIATGVGALPFFFVKDMSRRWLGISNAVAAGLMLAASFSLIYTGFEMSPARVCLGTLAGLVFILVSRRALGEHGGHANLEALQGGSGFSRDDLLTMLTIVGVMTAHSFAEGVGVGVSFGGGDVLGAFITASIAFHNIPEGLAISLVLVPRGVSAWRAAGWSVFSSLPQPLMAVPAYLFVEIFRPVLPAGLGFAAGAMIWMTMAELLPEAYEETDANTVALTLTLAVVAMFIFQALLAM